VVHNYAAAGVIENESGIADLRVVIRGEVGHRPLDGFMRAAGPMHDGCKKAFYGSALSGNSSDTVSCQLRRATGTFPCNAGFFHTQS
jgi:hypothetical protein